MATLRATYMDLANELGDQGFRWIFLVHNHGAPNNHKALNQASDYFHDVYGGTMVHLFGPKPVFLCCGPRRRCCLGSNSRRKASRCTLVRMSRVSFCSGGLNLCLRATIGSIADRNPNASLARRPFRAG